MNEMKVNSFIAFLIPPETVEGVQSYLAAACSSLRVFSDADLGRIIGTSPGAVASWKLRGRLSKNGTAWFRDEFVIEVFSRNSSNIYSHRSIDLAVALQTIANIGLDRFDLQRDVEPAMGAAWAIGGLTALAMFMRRMDTHSVLKATDVLLAEYPRILEECLWASAPLLEQGIGAAMWDLNHR